MTPYSLARSLPRPFDEVLAQTRTALAAEGFGVPTEMDTQAIFKAKLGQDSERRIILGACLPAVAFEAMQAEPELAVLLPCNVVVREVAGGTEVTAVKPTRLFTLTAKVDPAHAEVVEARLEAVLERLG
ncbi:MAG: DUF302 domain-containing protein [Holophagaceae bacterium]|nr:DUF302 domain-containing protein [Holophagaceae bacterium]